MPAREDRLARLYDKYNRAIRAYCLRRVRDDDVSDAVADVFAVAWRRIDDVPIEEVALPWLYGVARRVVADHYRSQNRRTRLTAKVSGVRPPVPIQPDLQVVQLAEYHQVHEALAALRGKDREILLLAAWEELSNSEIAEIVGCSTTAAAQRLYRAKQRLGRAYRAMSRNGLPPAVADGSERA